MGLNTWNIYLEKEIKEIKKSIYIVIAAIIWMAIIMFWFNQFLLKTYNQTLKDKNIEYKKIKQKIWVKEEQIQKLLEWKNFASIKQTQDIFDIYYKNRLTYLPKILIIEMLEEILPSTSKVWKHITINDNMSISLELYTDGDGLKWLADLYNKFLYYQNELHLIKIIRWFNTIKFDKWNEQYYKILWKKVNHIYKTTISFNINKDSLAKYYSLMYKPNSKTADFENYFWKGIIEPNLLPNNISISDIISLHKLYKEKNLTWSLNWTWTIEK